MRSGCKDDPDARNHATLTLSPDLASETTLTIRVRSSLKAGKDTTAEIVIIPAITMVRIVNAPDSTVRRSDDNFWHEPFTAYVESETEKNPKVRWSIDDVVIQGQTQYARAIIVPDPKNSTIACLKVPRNENGSGIRLTGDLQDARNTLIIRATSVEDPSMFDTREIIIAGMFFPGTFQEVMVGLAHVLALTWDWKLYAWGGNAYGQLGDGSTNPSLIPSHIDIKDPNNPARSLEELI